MVHSEMKNEYGFSAADIQAYREATGAGMMDARKHFIDIYVDSYRTKRKAKMVELVEAGSLEDIQKIVRMLIEDY